MPTTFIKKCVSTFNSISKNDMVHSAIVAAGSTVVGIVGTMYSNGGHIPNSLPEFQMIAKASFATFVGTLWVAWKSGPKTIEKQQDAPKKDPDGVVGNP